MEVCRKIGTAITHRRPNHFFIGDFQAVKLFHSLWVIRQALQHLAGAVPIPAKGRSVPHAATEAFAEPTLLDRRCNTNHDDCGGYFKSGKDVALKGDTIR